MKIIGLAPTDYHGYMRAGAAFRMAQSMQKHNIGGWLLEYVPAEEILAKGFAKTQNAKLLDQYAGILQAYEDETVVCCWVYSFPRQMVESFEKFCMDFVHTEIRLTFSDEQWKVEDKEVRGRYFLFYLPDKFRLRETRGGSHHAQRSFDRRIGENRFVTTIRLHLSSFLENYFICSIVRLPAVLEIGWKKEFWTPVIEKLAADSGVKRMLCLRLPICSLFSCRRCLLHHGNGRRFCSLRR